MFLIFFCKYFIHFFHYVKKQGNYANYKYDLNTNLLSNLEAEEQNFPDWTDQNFQKSAGLGHK